MDELAEKKKSTLHSKKIDMEFNLDISSKPRGTVINDPHKGGQHFHLIKEFHLQ